MFVTPMGMLVHSRPAIKRTGENGDSVLLAPNRTPACLLRPRGQIDDILYTGNERYYTGPYVLRSYSVPVAVPDQTLQSWR